MAWAWGHGGVLAKGVSARVSAFVYCDVSDEVFGEIYQMNVEGQSYNRVKHKLAALRSF